LLDSHPNIATIYGLEDSGATQAGSPKIPLSGAPDFDCCGRPIRVGCHGRRKALSFCSSDRAICAGSLYCRAELTLPFQEMTWAQNGAATRAGIGAWKNLSLPALT